MSRRGSPADRRLPDSRRANRQGAAKKMSSSKSGMDSTSGSASGNGHQRRIDVALLQLVEQFGIRTEHELDLKRRPPHLDIDDDARHGLDGQRIQRADLQPIRRIARGLARRANAIGHQRDHLLRDIGKHLRGFRRLQVAALVAEQRAAHALFERMQRPVHADRAHIQRLGRLRQVAGLHECEQHFQLAKGDLVVDSVAHLEPWNGRNVDYRLAAERDRIRRKPPFGSRSFITDPRFQAAAGTVVQRERRIHRQRELPRDREAQTPCRRYRDCATLPAG